MNPVYTQMLDAAATICGILFVAFIGYALTNFAKWTGIQLTANQRQIIMDAADAIAGALKVLIAQGKLNANDLHPANNQVAKTVTLHLTPDVQHALDQRKESVADLTLRALAMVGSDHTTLMLLAGPPIPLNHNNGGPR